MLTKAWRNANLRVIVVASNEVQLAAAKVRMEQMLKKFRIEAMVYRVLDPNALKPSDKSLTKFKSLGVDGELEFR